MYAGILLNNPLTTLSMLTWLPVVNSTNSCPNNSTERPSGRSRNSDSSNSSEGGSNSGLAAGGKQTSNLAAIG
ncbi:unnamed protein product [Ceratitis capitata]|uniref:(Mediterranean fruit fly) hypothetical protein n=1 Tax=Ceratitis capitata TaxID=7213 RepID=A0A811VJS7_CERCA|nr:unnamed protein product [Ceratitis capitata]